ncbi:hypothetical protein [Frankia sp. Cas3]|uniref:hypothetical protein n=1 Tax=Frankia sp. Cas3 TaxID=3073926 RepID=UPI002AD2B1C9|nr:hypothetical protein [Frankia sp. Cas3]
MSAYLLALIVGAVGILALLEIHPSTAGGDLSSRGTAPGPRTAPAAVLALAVGDVPDDRWQHGLCRTCGHLQDDHSFVGCAHSIQSQRCPCPIRSAIAPRCITCGDPVEGEPDDWGYGPEHLDCHDDDVEQDADAPPPAVAEVDPDLITAVLDRLDRPGMMAALTGWNWDDSDCTRAAAFIRAAVEAARGGAA